MSDDKKTTEVSLDKQPVATDNPTVIKGEPEIKIADIDVEIDGKDVDASRQPKPEIESELKTETQKEQNAFKRFFNSYWRRKKWTLPVTVLLLIAVLFAIPWSRYLILGNFVEKTYSVELLDTNNNTPISGAIVSIAGSKAQKVITDAKGKATLHVKVGNRSLAIDKKYYKTYTKTVFVGLASQKSAQRVQLVATGRQVPVVVLNKITGKPLADAVVKAVGTQVKTDKDGKAIIVLPADKPTLNGTLTAKGYNDQDLTIQVTESAVKENTFSIVPTGKLYFLSRLSGKIDVVKTNLDGGNRETVVAGTGKEEDQGTVLLASRDWKYLALLSKRESSPAKLYLIETDTDKLITMDEGDAIFNLAGWSNHTFAYSVTRTKVNSWEPNRQAVKTYDAEKKQILTVDQSQAEGDANGYKYQTLGSFYLIKDKLVYTTAWSIYSQYYNNNNLNLSDKSITIREISVGTTVKKDVKTFPASQYNLQQVIPYNADELYVGVYPQPSQPDSKVVFYEYDGGQVEQVSAADQEKIANINVYPTYLVSPAGDKTFWSEQRDGRDTFFVGGASGDNGKQVAALEDYQVYGWYSNDYLLLSKKGSELFIMPVGGGTQLKVTDYHKPQLSYRGYGGGYGGL